MSSGIGSSTSLSRHAVFHAATNIYALDYRRFSAIASQMEPFAELLFKRIQDQSQEMQDEEYRGFEAEFSRFKDELEHTGQLSSVLGDLAFAFEALLPASEESDVAVQAKIDKMRKGKTGILVLKDEVEALRAKMEAGCQKIDRLMLRLQSTMEGWVAVEGEEEGDLAFKEESTPQFFSFSTQSSSSSSSVSPTYSLGGDVTDDIRDTLLDRFDMAAWKKEAEELRLLEEQSGDISLPAFSPEPTPRTFSTLTTSSQEGTPREFSVLTTTLQESNLSFLQPLPETTPTAVVQTSPVQNLHTVNERMQNLLTNVNLLMERDAHLQTRMFTFEPSQKFPIQKKSRTPPLSLNSRSISAPASLVPSRRQSFALSIKNPENQKIVASPSPEEESGQFSEILTAKKEEGSLSLDAETSESSESASVPTPRAPEPSQTTEANGSGSRNLFSTTQIMQYPLSFVADPSPTTVLPSQRQEDDNGLGIVTADEVYSDPGRLMFPTTPKKFDTKKPDRSCGGSFVEWWNSCFSSRKVTDLDGRR